MFCRESSFELWVWIHWQLNEHGTIIPLSLAFLNDINKEDYFSLVLNYFNFLNKSYSDVTLYLKGVPIVSTPMDTNNNQKEH